MPHPETDPLRPRLFGYGLLYQARLSSSGELVPAPAEGPSEAMALAGALRALSAKRASGDPVSPPNEAGGGREDAWAVSVPFGRCGLEDRPLEYLIALGVSGGYLEELGPEGFAAYEVEADRIMTIVPGRIVRLRVRPRVGMRALVAFQTEDRTPLRGHAAPMSLSTRPSPQDHPARLQSAWQAFDSLCTMAQGDFSRYRLELDGFFARMSQALAGNGLLDQEQQEARQDGSYEVVDQRPLFERQQALLTGDLLDRVARADPEVFRFPGMFGAVCPLFSVLK